MSTPSIRASVIVPVRDGSHLLPDLLQALFAQTLPRDRFEVIVADDGSADRVTPPDEFQAEDWLKISRGPPLNSDAARNRGAELARGEVLAFIDSDCLPEPQWLEQGLRALEQADLVAGAVRFQRPDRLTVWALLDVDTTKDQERHVRLGNAETVNLLVRRSLFEEQGGFAAAFPYFGDFDFAQRCAASGKKLVYAADAVVWHPVRTDRERFLGMVWGANHSYAMQMTQEGKRPQALRLRNWLPVIQTYRGRRRAGRPFGLTEDWFRQNGIQLRRADHIRVLPAQYLLVPYLSLIAQVKGWLEGRSNGGAPRSDR